jgi:hypothetical protein
METLTILVALAAVAIAVTSAGAAVCPMTLLISSLEISL